MFGDFDFFFKVCVVDMGSYRKLLGDILLCLFGVSELWMYVVMEEVKSILLLCINLK